MGFLHRHKHKWEPLSIQERVNRVSQTVVATNVTAMCESCGETTTFRAAGFKMSQEAILKWVNMKFNIDPSNEQWVMEEKTEEN